MDSCWLLSAEVLAPAVEFFSLYSIRQKSYLLFFNSFFQSQDKCQVTKCEVSEHWILARVLASWWKSILTELSATSADVPQQKRLPKVPVLNYPYTRFLPVCQIVSESFSRPLWQGRGSSEQRAGIHRECSQSADWQATLGPDDLIRHFRNLIARQGCCLSLHWQNSSHDGAWYCRERKLGW